jgi:hypothetical protein
MLNRSTLTAAFSVLMAIMSGLQRLLVALGRLRKSYRALRERRAQRKQRVSQDRRTQVSQPAQREAIKQPAQRKGDASEVAKQGSPASERQLPRRRDAVRRALRPVRVNGN